MKRILLFLTALGSLEASAQNTCATAMAITPGTYTVAAVDGPEIPFPICAPNGTTNVTASEWYTYTPLQDTLLTITTDLPQNTGGDTRFHVYTGSCGALVCAGGDDDSGSGFLSVGSVSVQGGVTYTIAFDNRWSANGFDFQLIENAPPSPGSECSTAITVMEGVYTVDAVAGMVPMPNCIAGISNATHGAWYRYVATADTALIVTTDLAQNSGGDTRFHVYSGTCAFLNCVAGDDDAGSGNLAVDTFNVSNGTVYYIAFDDSWSSDGFDFQIQQTPRPPVPISFTQAANPAGSALGVVDMNGDHLDDIVSPGSASVTIGYQQPNGTLTAMVRTTPVTQHIASWSFCVGDIDDNGFADMMYGSGGGASFMMANGDGTAYSEVSFPQYIFCQRTNMVDLDNDGDLDAFSCHDVDANVYFTNDGTGALTFNQGGLGPTCGNYGSIWVDYDNDGDQDLFIAKCGCDPVDLFMRNDGNLSFTSIAAQQGFADTQQSWSSAWGDFDNDGDLDVLVGSSSGTDHKLMRNDGGSFTNVTIGSGIDVYDGSSIEWVSQDFNNDGYLDILGGNGMLFGRGDMTFYSVEETPTNGPIGDVNGDGFLDIVNGGQLYLNDGNSNHWLTVSAVGTTSNAMGIGARVQITTANGMQIRDIRSGDGFRYMSSLNAHFGLGTDSVITDLMVFWPSGEISLLHDIPSDTAIVVVEGLSTDVADVATTTSGLQLYPNPVENTLYVHAAQDLGNRAVRVMDATGKVVLRGMLRNGTLDVSGLGRGVYLLMTDVNGTVLNGRFVKQ